MSCSLDSANTSRPMPAQYLTARAHRGALTARVQRRPRPVVGTSCAASPCCERELGVSGTSPPPTVFVSSATTVTLAVHQERTVPERVVPAITRARQRASSRQRRGCLSDIGEIHVSRN